MTKKDFPTDQEILVRFTTDVNDVALDAIAPPESSEVEQQAWWLARRKTLVIDVPMKVSALTSEISGLAGAIQGALEPREAKSGSFRVDSFEVGFSINASGKVALVAEIGAEASITVTFKRI